MAEDIDKLIKRDQAKMKQKESRKKAEKRGTAGRPDQKGKAKKTNKHSGGKMAK